MTCAQHVDNGKSCSDGQYMGKRFWANRQNRRLRALSAYLRQLPTLFRVMWPQGRRGSTPFSGTLSKSPLRRHKRRFEGRFLFLRILPKVRGNARVCEEKQCCGQNMGKMGKPLPTPYSPLPNTSSIAFTVTSFDTLAYTSVTAVDECPMIFEITGIGTPFIASHDPVV